MGKSGSKLKPKTVTLNTDTGKVRTELKIMKEKTPFGEYEMYVIEDIEVPYREIISLAQKLRHPIYYRGQKFFPEGKMAIHFINKKKK